VQVIESTQIEPPRATDQAQPPERQQWAQYESEKADWRGRHPSATDEQYQAAIAAIASRLGL